MPVETEGAEEVTTFTPCRDRVLLKRTDGQSKTESGFVIPEAAKEKPTECEVVAVSPSYVSEFTGTTMYPFVEVGQRVLIGKYSGSSEIKLDGVDHIVVKWDEILGIKKEQE